MYRCDRKDRDVTYSYVYANVPYIYVHIGEFDGGVAKEMDVSYCRSWNSCKLLYWWYHSGREYKCLLMFTYKIQRFSFFRLELHLPNKNITLPNNSSRKVRNSSWVRSVPNGPSPAPEQLRRAATASISNLL